jgi:hypothetical protein
MVYPGTLFHRRQRGIPMHSYENRSRIRAQHAQEFSRSYCGTRQPLRLMRESKLRDGPAGATDRATGAVLGRAHALPGPKTFSRTGWRL